MPKKGTKTHNKPMIYLLSFLIALLCCIPLFAGFAYFMTVKTCSTQVVSIASAIIIGVFSFLFSYFVCKRLTKQKGIGAIICAVITLILIFGMRLFYSAPSYDSMILIKSFIILVGSAIGLLLSSGYGKKRR